VEGALFFFAPSFVRASFLSRWLLLNLTGLNQGQLEIQKRYKIDRQKVGPGVLGAQMETPNPHCLFPQSLFFKALLAFKVFFKTFLKTSFLRLSLSHDFSLLIFSLIALKVFCPQACGFSLAFCL
jgi:hypothetical protein